MQVLNLGKRRCNFVNNKHNDVGIMDTSLGKMLNKIDDPDVWIKIMDRINDAFIEQDKTIMGNGDVDTNIDDIHISTLSNSTLKEADKD